jgi:predicted nuclease of predicted toxin-antitoxin system
MSEEAGPSLLLDNNLSYRLLAKIAELYPGSTHVARLGMDTASDDEIYRLASARGVIVVTKDQDFVSMGRPATGAKVVRLRTGNTSTAAIGALLAERHAEIVAFARSDRTLLYLP